MAVAGGTMAGLAALQSLQMSRGSLPVWLGADLLTIVTHASGKVRIVLVDALLGRVVMVTYGRREQAISRVG
ncbi:hypothetical protein [Demequina oxidasica]|uniref:hypothetical protein n=1 Tax=Demequina oxidasica TaxID=676199 RepID=UPI00128BF1DC|nr:hypothetical protein [Demequina oxidasica]